METEVFHIDTSRRVSIVAIMTALALVGNYSLVMIPNVELGSTILFVTAYTFGWTIGAPCALIMSVVFGFVNPWGFTIPEILVTQIIAWLYIVAVGAMIGSSNPMERTKIAKRWQLAATGLFLTLFFDLLTNYGYAVAFGLPYWVTLVTGIPFMVVHVVSNTVIFGAVIPKLDTTIKTQFRFSIWKSTSGFNYLSEE
ncbi:MAG: hypothetical protein JSW05_13245 [Candidatus Thorarchaeota archaeon]|nr:MAG: hypothetical protein JSW05_13245 [Candidatus Thorarchaeota archaeon]